MKCDCGEVLDEMLRDQLVVGVFREDIRRKLLADHKLTLKRAVQITEIEEQVDKDSHMFHRLHNKMSTGQHIEHIQKTDDSTKQVRKTTANNKRICYKCGGFHDDQQSYDNCYAGKLKCIFCRKMGHISRICCTKQKFAAKSQHKAPKTQVNEIPYLEFLEGSSRPKYEQEQGEPTSHLINNILLMDVIRFIFSKSVKKHFGTSGRSN